MAYDLSLRRVRRPVFRIAALLWILLLTVGSLQPARPRVVKRVHREIHWVGFAGAAVLLFCQSRTRREEIVAAAATVLLGVSLEFLQHVIYRGSMEWRDIGDDGLAVLLAFALYRMAAAWRITPDPRE
jgi:hypothetical protein